MKIPEARESAESESLDMLVDLGRVCLSRRRMHAAGGSKSCVVVVLFVAAAADLLLAGGAAALEDSTTAVDSLLLLSVTVSAAAEEEAAVDCCSVVEESAAAAVVVSMVVFIIFAGRPRAAACRLEIDVGTIDKVPALSVLAVLPKGRYLPKAKRGAGPETCLLLTIIFEFCAVALHRRFFTFGDRWLDSCLHRR